MTLLNKYGITMVRMFSPTGFGFIRLWAAFIFRSLHILAQMKSPRREFIMGSMQLRQRETRVLDRVKLRHREFRGRDAEESVKFLISLEHD